MKKTFIFLICFIFSTSSCVSESEFGTEPNPTETETKAKNKGPNNLDKKDKVKPDQENKNCLSKFSFDGKNESIQSIFVAGEFNNWSKTKHPLKDEDNDNIWETSLEIKNGVYAYKFIKNGQWILDPKNPAKIKSGNYENSKLEVKGCDSIIKGQNLKEGFSLGKIDKNFDGNSMEVVVAFDPSKISASSISVKVNRVLQKKNIELAEKNLKITLNGLKAGSKYTILLTAKSQKDKSLKKLFLPIWFERENFNWQDAVLYFANTDRFFNGDNTNDWKAGSFPDVPFQTRRQGGDFKGIIQKIKSGYFSKLGVNAIWISSPVDNPEVALPGDMGKKFSSYHGYFPNSFTQVEEHFGTKEDLHQLIELAQANGIRILIDFVANHVYVKHQLWQKNKNTDWFHSFQACRPSWSQPIECWFESYLPDLNYSNPKVVQTMVDNAIWWIQEYSLDGFRLDAVKHMVHDFTRNLKYQVKNQIETTPEQKFYMVGETFVGTWANNGQKDIKDYVNKDELDGQFDFPLYWEILKTVIRREQGFNGLDQVIRNSLDQNYYGAEAIMSNFLGNHDTPRVISHAGNQIANMWGNGSKGQGWKNPPKIPFKQSAFKKVKIAFSLLFSLKGIPLIYCGDEIGIPGAGDPDNRRMMQFGSQLSAQQKDLLSHVEKLAQIRRGHKSLSRGKRSTLWVDETFYAMAKKHKDQEFITVLNLSGQEQSRELNINSFAAQKSKFKDLISGKVFEAKSGKLYVTAAAESSLMLLGQ